MIGSFTDVKMKNFLNDLTADASFDASQKEVCKALLEKIAGQAKCRYLIKKALIRPADNGIKGAGTMVVLTGDIVGNVFGSCTNMVLICAAFDSAGEALLEDSSLDEKLTKKIGTAALTLFVENLEKQIEEEYSWDEKHVISTFYPGTGPLPEEVSEMIISSLEADDKLKLIKADGQRTTYLLTALMAIAPDAAASRATCKGCPGCEVATICRFNNIVRAEEKKRAKEEAAAE